MSPAAPPDRHQWPDEAACAASARALAAALRPALRQGRAIVIELRGTLGAGKTTFTRHLLRALGIEGRIKSPSYAVVESYQTPGVNSPVHIWHFDFYRFNDPTEWEDAGFRDIFSSPGLKVVEWPDQVGNLLPPADICIDIQPESSDIRTVSSHSDHAMGEPYLTAWQQERLAPPAPDA